MVRHAFNKGITHFDLANNYGPPYGRCFESRVSRTVIRSGFEPYRDELFISSKAGYDMWPGPYGDYGSRKYLISSLDQSLKRTGLDYVGCLLSISSPGSAETPLEETMSALDHVVRQGKLFYAGISNYPADLTAKQRKILRDLGTPCLIHQPSIPFSIGD
jgi:L-glyceraldehyde 3-phosphate reductase